ncbi:MAG: malate/lactate/ureidoglycolate dehydrogenase [Betaproteobacteria bacterium]|nr:malate/lactate/ureidoglycolate dehydrogenase [Betaproteobacteria bacterium]
MKTLQASRLERLGADILAGAGCSRAEADRVAGYLVGANLAGHDSHGVARLPRYVQMLGSGVMVADQVVDVVVDTPVLAVVDGKFGFGQTVAEQAVAVGVGKCRDAGLAAVGVRNAGHLGRIADWAELAAREGFVSIHFVNAAGSVLVAPFGSVDRRFSTAPYCVGVPVAGREPVMLDFATSVVAEGKVFVASQGGKPVPEDALIGPDGTPGNDPHLLYGDYESTGRRDVRNGSGAIRSFGDHKGSGLALMCEVLGGALSGNGCTAPDRRFANGMLSIYIDPARLDPDDMFPAEVKRYLAFVKSARPAAEGQEILLPGEPEKRMREERLANGIPLSDETWSLLGECARSVGVNAG